MRRSASFTESFRELGLLAFIVVICVIFQIRNRNFLMLSNIQDLLTNTAILSIMSVGMMMVILTRGIDLSVGAIVAVAGMVSALAVDLFRGISPVASILEAIAVGTVAGVLNGLLVARFDVLPIVATLGTMNIIRGVTYVISGGAWVSSYQMSHGFGRWNSQRRGARRQQSSHHRRGDQCSCSSILSTTCGRGAIYAVGLQPGGRGHFLASSPADHVSGWSTPSWAPFRDWGRDLGGQVRSRAK